MPDIEIYRVDTHQLTPGEYETLCKILRGWAPITRTDPRDPRDPRNLRVHWPIKNGPIESISPLVEQCKLHKLQ